MYDTAEIAQEWYVKQRHLSLQAALNLTEIQREQLRHKGMGKILTEATVSLKDLLEIIKTPLPTYVLLLLERRPMARFIEGVLKAAQETGDSAIEKLKELFCQEEEFFTKLEFTSNKGIRVRSLQGYLAASSRGSLSLNLEKLMALEDHQIQNLYIFSESVNKGEALGRFLSEGIASANPTDVLSFKEDGGLLKQILQLPIEINDSAKKKLILVLNHPGVKERLGKNLWGLDNISQVINSMSPEEDLPYLLEYYRNKRLEFLDGYACLGQCILHCSSSFSVFINLALQVCQILCKHILTLPHIIEIFRNLESRSALAEEVVQHLLHKFPLPYPAYILFLLREEDSNVKLLLGKTEQDWQLAQLGKTEQPPQLAQKLSSILSIPQSVGGIRKRIWSLPQIFQVIELLPSEKLIALKECLLKKTTQEIFPLVIKQILQCTHSPATLSSFPLQAPQLLDKGAITLLQILELLDLAWKKPTLLDRVLEHLECSPHFIYVHIKALFNEEEGLSITFLERIKSRPELINEINNDITSLNEKLAVERTRQLRIAQAQCEIQVLAPVLAVKRKLIIEAEVNQLEKQYKEEANEARSSAANLPGTILQYPTLKGSSSANKQEERHL